MLTLVMRYICWILKRGEILAASTLDDFGTTQRRRRRQRRWVGWMVQSDLVFGASGTLECSKAVYGLTSVVYKAKVQCYAKEKMRKIEEKVETFSSSCLSYYIQCHLPSTQSRTCTMYTMRASSKINLKHIILYMYIVVLVKQKLGKNESKKNFHGALD